MMQVTLTRISYKMSITEMARWTVSSWNYSSSVETNIYEWLYM